MLPAKFGSIWPSSFRGEDFFNISQSETRIALVGHICWRNGTKWRNFIEDQVWFNLVQLFQRSRLKYEKLTDGRRTTDAKWWQYLTWPFGSGELIMTSQYILVLISFSLFNLLHLILTNTDRLQRVEDYVKNCTWQLIKIKTIYRFPQLTFDKRDSSLCRL